MNNKGCLGIGSFGLILIGIVAIVVFWGFGAYNSLIKANNDVQEKWANVETVYQKRANLIPNLENTVKSYSKYEQTTLTEVIAARSKATSVTIDPSNMTEADMAKFQSIQGELTGSLSRLMAVVEQYPNLKADQQYIAFQREYIAIENSIRFETVNYNTSVKDFNNNVQTFPNSILATIFPKFAAKPMFKANAGAEKAPTVFQGN